MSTLRELPHIADNVFPEDKVYALLDIEIKETITVFDEEIVTPWIGKEKYVYVWYKLANSYAVGFNENPNRGYSFPVKKYKG